MTPGLGKSLGGLWVFHVTTHLANVPNDNIWQDTWEAWFTQALHKMFELEEKTHGRDPELNELKQSV